MNTLNNKSTMITRKWNKKNVQKVLKQLRNVKNPKGQSLFNVTNWH